MTAEERSRMARRRAQWSGRTKATKRGLPLNVYRHKQRWRAQIVVDGKHLTLASAPTVLEAGIIAAEAKVRYHDLPPGEAVRRVFDGFVDPKHLETSWRALHGES